MLALLTTPLGAYAQGGQDYPGPKGKQDDPERGLTIHRLITCTDGSIMGWGGNYNGELGSNGVGQALPTPVLVPKPADLNAVKVLATLTSSFAIDAKGYLWGWGANSNGKLGLGPGVIQTPTPQRIPGISEVVAVAAGYYHALALCADGTLWSWGNADAGALGTGAGVTGNVYNPQKIAGLPGIKAIASDGYFNLALDVEGNIWAWGTDQFGELGLGLAPGTVQATPARIRPFGTVRHFDVGYNRAAAVLTDGSVWDWGANYGGMLGLGHANYVNTPTRVTRYRNAVSVALATATTLVMTNDTNGPSNTYVWGENTYGELGIGAANPGFAPRPVPGPRLSFNAEISADQSSFMCIERTGEVKTWGLQYLGYTPVYSPTAPLPNGGSGCTVPTLVRNACLAVPDSDFPGCGPLRAYFQRPGATYEAVRHNFTISPAEIGFYGVLTTIDASLAPYNGTVVFDGIYHVRGDVEIINGNFTLTENTRFYVNSLSGNGSDVARTTITLRNATGRIESAVLQGSCGQYWQGILLDGGGQTLHV